MSNARYASIFAFAAALIAAGCTGITIDVAGDASEELPTGVSDRSIAERYLVARPQYAGSLVVNAKKDSVTLVMKTVGGCEKDGDEFVWNPDFYYGDSATFGYRFNGDTLFLSTRSLIEKGFEDPEEMLVERILIGNDNEGLDGVWLMTPCSYFDGKLRCSEYAYEEFLLIDGGDVEQRILDKDNFDYMESVFIGELFSYIADGSSALQLETVFYGSDTEYEAERYGIKVLSKSKTSMTFELDKRKFDVVLNSVNYRDSVNVVVSSDGVECVGTYGEETEMSSDMCSVENADVLKESSTGAWMYWSQNDDEFVRCIDGLIGRERD